MSYIPSGNTVLRGRIVCNFLAAELLTSLAADFRPLYIISPWVTDFALAVGEREALDYLLEASVTPPRLFEVLRQIASHGRSVVIVVRPEYQVARHRQLVEPLRELARSSPRIVVGMLPELHSKIVVGQHGGLYGSLNLTETGVERNLEWVRYVSDHRNLAKLAGEAEAIRQRACAQMAGNYS